MNLKNFDIKKAFSDFKIIKTIDLFDFYKSFQPSVKKSTVNWRIHELVQSGQLQRIGWGKFVVGKELKYIPEISSREIKIINLLKKDFPFISCCIWSSPILNEFSQHLAAFQSIIVEVEKEALESVYYKLKEKFGATYKKPAKKIVEDFILSQPKSIVVNSLVSQSPIQSIKNIPTLTLEKLLVDLYCDKNLFYFLQGNELVNIYKNAFDKYTINKSKLLRYADRRRKKLKIGGFIKSIIRQQTKINDNNLIYDIK